MEDSSVAEKPTEKEESQKSQTRTPEGNIAPHCEHVLVTGKFCAADASTPVRREPPETTTCEKYQASKRQSLSRKKHQEQGGKNERGELGIHLAREQVTAEGDAALQCDGGKVSALCAFHFCPRLH